MQLRVAELRVAFWVGPPPARCGFRVRALSRKEPLHVLAQVMRSDGLATVSCHPATLVLFEKLADQALVVHAPGVKAAGREHPPEGVEQGVLHAAVPCRQDTSHIGLGRGEGASGPCPAGELRDLQQGTPVQPDAVDQAVGLLVDLRQGVEIGCPACELAAAYLKGRLVALVKILQPAGFGRRSALHDQCHAARLHRLCRELALRRHRDRRETVEAARVILPVRAWHLTMDEGKPAVVSGVEDSDQFRTGVLVEGVVRFVPQHGPVMSVRLAVERGARQRARGHGARRAILQRGHRRRLAAVLEHGQEQQSRRMADAQLLTQQQVRMSRPQRFCVAMRGRHGENLFEYGHDVVEHLADVGHRRTPRFNTGVGLRRFASVDALPNDFTELVVEAAERGREQRGDAFSCPPQLNRVEPRGRIENGPIDGVAQPAML
jgi:hypothetical protein